MLKYVTSENINRERWNELTNSAKNSSIFCLDWYLDAFCEWDAIILDDYKGAIALPKKQKLIFKQLYQPAFIQKCVWFGDDVAPEDIFKLLKKSFDKVHFNCNLRFKTETKPRVNLILSLTNPELNSKLYSKTLRKNIRKANDVGLSVKQDQHYVTHIVELYKEAYGGLNNQLSNADYTQVSQISKSETDNDYFEVLTVWKQDKLVAGLLFAKANNRLHYILGAPNAEGRKLNALSFGLDYIIKKYSNSTYTLDFEGSSIPNVMAFYESFGAKNEGFYETKFTPNFLLRIMESIYNRFIKS